MPQNPHVLIVDSTIADGQSLAERLHGAGFICEHTADGKDGLQRAIKGKWDAVIVEFEIPELGGIQFITDLLLKQSRMPIVAISGKDSSEAAIESIKAGAYDFLLKPIDLEELTDVLHRGLEDARRMSKPVEIGEVYPEQDTIVGRSRPMREIYKQLGRIAAQPVTVLVRGETGTGKELIARAIYQHGHRAHRPFIAVNCAAIPEALLESELFGHEKGAYTGADKLRIGRFEQAHNGTLFLDEIGDLDGALQAKLLRVLQEKTIQRVGGNQEIPVDVRIIAATHRNLEQMVRENDFRMDLFYRLNVATIEIPPLRERREDIPMLVDYFIKRHALEYGIENPSIQSQAVDFLKAQDWPGNIRQLQNIIRKALLQSRGYTISWQDVRNLIEQEDSAVYPEGDPDQDGDGLRQLVATTLSEVIDGRVEEALPVLQEAFEREVYGQVIQRSGGNQARAARWLGVSRLTLREKLKQYGLHPGQTGES